MKEKQISYSYPSSTNASRFQRSRHGCYTVSVIPNFATGLPQAIAAFSTLEEARKYAETLAEPWGRYTL